MHARVAAFENPRFDDPSMLDELSKRTREASQRWRDALGTALGHVQLVDRESKRALGITFFGSEEEIREAEPVFERMGDEFPEELRGRRTSVETYEAAVNELGEGGRFARVSRLEGGPEVLEEAGRRSEEEILPRLRQIDGFKGAAALIDRGSGRTLLLTLWESEQAMRASEEQADALRQQSADAGRGRVAGVERYEVSFADVSSLVGSTS